MIKKFKNNFKVIFIFLSINVFLCLPLLICLPLSKDFTAHSTSGLINNTNISYPKEKRAFPTYDTIMGDDGLPHYRVLFWVPKTATKFIPYVDAGVKTDVSSHGPVEKWSVEEIKNANDHEKLVFIFVPKTFVYLYGKGFEKVIHLKYK